MCNFKVGIQPVGREKIIWQLRTKVYGKNWYSKMIDFTHRNIKKLLEFYMPSTLSFVSIDWAYFILTVSP